MSAPACTPELAADTRGPGLLGVAFGMWGLAIVAVALRFYSRRLARAPYWYDDWLALLALVMSGGYSFSTIPLYSKGMGKHVMCADADAIPFFLKTLLAWEFLYTLIIMTVKYSILLFLWRLFSVHNFKKYFWAVWILVTAWAIGVLITSALSCIPLHAFWGQGTGTCVDTKKFFFGNAIPNIVTDVILLTLPIPWILRLNLSKALRYSLLGVFACGAFVVVTSCYRLYILLSTDAGPDVTYNDISEVQWTIIEGNAAIVSACLPSMSPLIRKALGAFNISFSQSESPPSSSKRWMGREKSSVSDHPSSRTLSNADTEVDVPPSTITLTKTFSVYRTEDPDTRFDAP